MTVAPLTSLEGDIKEFTTADQVALGDLGIRKTVARFLVVLFAVSNVFMLAFLGWLYWNDQAMIVQKIISPADRLASPAVLMALIGGTTVQLGTVVLTMTQAIFPRRSGGDA